MANYLEPMSGDRRRWQFSLRSLFLVILLAALAMSAWSNFRPIVPSPLAREYGYGMILRGGSGLNEDVSLEDLPDGMEDTSGVIIRGLSGGNHQTPRGVSRIHRLRVSINPKKFTVEEFASTALANMKQNALDVADSGGAKVQNIEYGV